jgi:hypothetical protein
MSGDGWLDPGTCGVKLSQFEQMATEMSRSAPRLEQLSHQLWQALNTAGVSTEPAMEIKRIAQWAKEAATDLRRRNSLVREMDRQKLAFSFSTPDGTYFKLPDRYKDQLAYANGKRAVDLLRRAKDGDREALRQISNLALGPDSRNPYFTKAFLEKLGAADMVEIPIMLAQRLRRDTRDGYDDLQNSARDTRGALMLLSKSLAAGTDPTSRAHMDDDYLRQLRDAGRRMFPPSSQPPYGVSGYQGLSTVLAQTSSHSERFSAHFMEVVGRDMVAFDRETHKRLPYVVLPDLTGLNDLGDALDPGTGEVSPGARKTDMLAPLLTAAGESKEASQALLDYTTPGEKNSHLAYLLHDRRALWGQSDHGAALGQAMKAAMSGRDDISERLTFQAGDILAADARKFFEVGDDRKLKTKDKYTLDALSGLRTPMAEILAAHIGKINDIYLSFSGGAKEGSTPMTDTDLDYMLLDVLRDSPNTRDDRAFTTLLDAQIAHARVEIDRAVASGSRQYLTNVVVSESPVFGHLLEARNQSVLAEKGRIDAANAQLKTRVSQGIGLIPIKGSEKVGEIGGGLAQGAYNAVVQGGLDKLGSWMSKTASEQPVQTDI